MNNRGELLRICNSFNLQIFGPRNVEEERKRSQAQDLESLVLSVVKDQTKNHANVPLDLFIDLDRQLPAQKKIARIIKANYIFDEFLK